MANPETKALVDQSLKIVLGLTLLPLYALPLTLLFLALMAGVTSLFFR